MAYRAATATLLRRQKPVLLLGPAWWPGGRHKAIPCRHDPWRLSSTSCSRPVAALSFQFSKRESTLIFWRRFSVLWKPAAFRVFLQFTEFTSWYIFRAQPKRRNFPKHDPTLSSVEDAHKYDSKAPVWYFERETSFPPFPLQFSNLLLHIWQHQVSLLSRKYHSSCHVFHASQLWQPVPRLSREETSKDCWPEFSSLRVAQKSSQKKIDEDFVPLCRN